MSDDSEYYAEQNEGGELVECPECGEECEESADGRTFCPECGWEAGHGDA
jgi:transposase